ncbi:unnamed protein product [Adineta steineri]|uniref:Uncharacterized protein n=1 Tax=Adineta steineri TaxID=433720 RepID=A0A813MI64_9BILA|nr:unnamed protein product [Adineta steineri]CAF0729687.1 unnamed protein product [Adineta steineri]CAF3549373.1 unnamed protein product [Adineta steineri]CAF3665221.1 unnamed protein product [Adineta steineri]
MLFDILAVFVVTLISSLFLCTTSIHGLPTSPSTHHNIHNHPSSSLRLLHQHPVPSVDYDLGGDTSEMLFGESNELSTTNHHHANDLSSSSLTSSSDASNVPFDFYLNQLPAKLLNRKLLLSLQKHNQQKEGKEQQQQKRASSPSITASSPLPAEFNLNSAVAAAAFADPSDPDSVVNLSQLSESTRLSPSLKDLVEKNPFARAWLTMLLQKVMEEQPTPYIFKYGRRRK